MADGARIVTCPKHGIPYDASKRGGCTRCIREWEQQKAGPRGAGFPTSVKVLGLVLVAAGIFYFINRAPETTEEIPAATPVATTAKNPHDAASEKALREIVDALPHLIQAGRAEAESYIADSSDPDRQREDWEFWTPDWKARVSRVANKFPERPDSGENLKLALLYQEARRAVQQLETVPEAVKDGLPDSAQVKQRFDTAEKALQQARLHLSQLNK